MSDYVVQSGDNLWQIVRNYYGDSSLSENEIAQKVEELSAFNEISNPSNIAVNSTLDLSCFEENDELTHEIKEGESLWGIVQDYYKDNNLNSEEISQKVSMLAEYNNIEDESCILAGDKLDLSCFSETNKKTEEISFRQGAPDELEYENEALRSKAEELYNNSQLYVLDENAIRTAPTLDSDGNVVANVEYYESDVEGDLSGLTIMVNAGHGGYNPEGTSFDPGAVNEDEKAEEWAINLDYAQDLAEKLLEQGADVIITQGNYQTLSDCVDDFADEYGEDNNENLRLISLHCNSGGENSSGILYVNSDGNNQLIDYLEEAAQDADLNVEGDTQRNTNICLCANKNNIENALVEIGYISNKNELDMILEDEEFKDEFLDSIVDGIKLSVA